MTDVLAAGLSGLQQGVSALNQAASQLTQSFGNESADDASGTALANPAAESQDAANANSSDSSGGNTDLSNLASSNLANNVVSLKEAEQQVEVSSKVVEAADETLGTLLDVEA